MSSELAEPGLLDYAQRAPRPPAPLDPAADQLEIPLETRVSMYETQQVLRQMEKRAHDLFLQNLVKGTSHLSLGMEAVATGFATAMRPDDYTFATYRGPRPHDGAGSAAGTRLGGTAWADRTGCSPARVARCTSPRSSTG